MAFEAQNESPYTYNSSSNFSSERRGSKQRLETAKASLSDREGLDLGELDLMNLFLVVVSFKLSLRGALLSSFQASSLVILGWSLAT